MWKMFLQAVFLALAVTNLSAFREATSGKRYYECLPDTRTEVRIYGFGAQKCPTNTFCNERYLILPGDDMPRSCMAVTALCPYECIDDHTCNVNNVKIECPLFSKCNKEKTSCETCLCDKTSFTCRDSQTAILTGVDGTLDCSSVDKYCNVNYERPCSPCIDNQTTTYTSKTGHMLT